MNEWGKRLQHVLRVRDMNQAQVAQQLHVSPPAVNKWLSGGNVGYHHLRRLGDLLRVNWVWLRWGDDALASVLNEINDDDLRLAYCIEHVANQHRTATDNESIYALACSLLGIGALSYNFLTSQIHLSKIARHIYALPSAHWITRDAFRNRILPEDIPEKASLVKAILAREPQLWIADYRLKHRRSRYVRQIILPTNDRVGRTYTGIGFARWLEIDEPPRYVGGVVFDMDKPMVNILKSSRL